MSETIKDVIARTLARSDWPALDKLAHRLFFGPTLGKPCTGLLYEAHPTLPADKPGSGLIARLVTGKNVVAVARGLERDHYGNHRCSLCGAYGDRDVLAEPHVAPPPRYCLDMGEAWKLRVRLASLGWESEEEIALQAGPAGGSLDYYHFMFRPQTIDPCQVKKTGSIVQYGFNGKLRSAPLIITKSALTLFGEQLADNPPAPRPFAEDS